MVLSPREPLPVFLKIPLSPWEIIFPVILQKNDLQIWNQHLWLPLNPSKPENKKILQFFFIFYTKPEIARNCLLIPYYSNTTNFVVRENEISIRYSAFTEWKKFFRNFVHTNQVMVAWGFIARARLQAWALCKSPVSYWTFAQYSCLQFSSCNEPQAPMHQLVLTYTLVPSTPSLVHTHTQ